MKLVIDKMRTDFGLVVATRVAAGVWAKGDEAAAGGEIRRAVEANDEALILSWSRWLAKLALQDVMAYQPAGPVIELPRGCRECRHFARPGRADGYCAWRDDLVRVYGITHPLNVLPADGGISCARFVRGE